MVYTNLKMDHIIKDNLKIINFKEGVNWLINLMI
jgi:hypothetical protein